MHWRTSQREASDGFTLVEVLVALLILTGVSAAFGLVLGVTTRFAVQDDVRGRASQLAAREVERMRTSPWTTAAVSTASTCVGGELVRTTAAPAIAEMATQNDASGKVLTIRNSITWAGVACGSAQPSYGQLRMLSRVEWTESGKATYTTIANYRVPPSDSLLPINVAAAASPAPTAAASPVPSGAASAAPDASPTASAAVMTTPTFSNFTPAAPNKRYCSSGGRTVQALAVTVDVTGINAGEVATLTWGAPGESASAAGSTVGPDINRFSFTMPARSTATLGTAELKISLAATATHTASTHTETFEVFPAKNSQRCV